MLNKTSKGLDMHVSDIRNDITNKLDYIVTSFDETLTATTRLISDFDADIDPLIANMTATSEKTAALITSLTLLSDKATALIAPGSPVNAKVISALREISDAMRSFRQLAESLERTPEAIIRGKK